MSTGKVVLALDGMGGDHAPASEIEGAALANGVSYGTAAGILLVVFVRESGHTVRDTLLVRAADLGDLLRASARVGSAAVAPGARGRAS